MTSDATPKDATSKRKSRARAIEATPDAARDGTAPFEESLERLEAIVDRLEQGELELEASLAAFEEGVALTRRCAGQLDEAERRIEVLVNTGDQWLVRPFDPSEADE